MESDPQAVQPSLLVISQSPQRIREAAARAQKKLDLFINEKVGTRVVDVSSGEKAKARIHTVNSGLRNTVISTEQELDQVLTRLRDKCLPELKNGARVRFEE